MKKMALFLLLFLVASFPGASCPLAASRGISVVSKQGQVLNLYHEYHALVVGVSEYDHWPGLPYAANDAREVEQKLKELGFQTTLLLNPDSEQLKGALGHLTYQIGAHAERALLFYFAGHGETEVLTDGTRMGYVIPKDCPLLQKDPIGFSRRAVSMKEIETACLRIRSRHVLMLFDSCFSGALFSLVRAVPNDIREKTILPVRQFITAGREDEQVPDRSMFKRCFLIGLDGAADLTGDGYITGSEMGLYLSQHVVKYTNQRQHPQYGKINNPDLDQGDFVFVPPRTVEKQMQQRALQNERETLAQDIDRLRAERNETQQLLEEMRNLLRERSRLEEQGRQSIEEKQELESQVALLSQERETIESLVDTKVREYEAKLTSSRQTELEEAQKRKALEEQLKRLAEEKNEALRQNQQLRALQEKAQEEAVKRRALEAEVARLRAVEAAMQRQTQPADVPREPAPHTAATAKTASEEQKSASRFSPSPGPAPETPGADGMKRGQDPDNIAIQEAILEAEKQRLQQKTPDPEEIKAPQTHPAKEGIELAARTRPPSPVPDTAATLIVNSNVEGAQVYIGREKVSFWAAPDEGWIYRGTTPFTTRDLPPGEHQIRVVKEGYDAEEKRVLIQPNEVTEVDIRILRSLPGSLGEDYGGGGGGGGL